MTDALEPVVIAPEDMDELSIAKYRLENPRLIARLGDLLGKPIEAGFKMLPKDWNKKIGGIVQSALLTGLDFAVFTMGKKDGKRSADWFHRLLVTGSGAAGGALGLASLPVELPFSTTIMLRSIADIARSEGFDITRLDIKLACLEVLALGGGSQKDDATENGYWIVRGALAKSVSDAAKYIAERGLADEAAPPIIRFITTIAARYGVVITESAAAKMVPVVGALGGGTINLMFMHHFQEVARGHFVIKRLEAKYGSNVVRAAYEKIVI